MKREVQFLKSAWKRCASVFLSAAMAVTVFAGCSGNGSTTTAASAAAGSSQSGAAASSVSADNGQKYTLNFWTLFTGGDGDVMAKVVKAFNDSHPNIQVKITTLEWGDPYYTKLETSVAAGNGPDIGVSHITKLPELVSQNVLSSLDDYTQSCSINWNNYGQNVMQSSTFNGKHYSIPLDFHPYVLYYNKTLLQKSGMLNGKEEPDITPGEDGKGFADFLVKLKSKLPSGVSPLAETESGDDVYRFWWTLYNQAGGKDFVSDDGGSAKIDTEPAVKAINYMKDLFDKYQVIPKNLNKDHFSDKFQNQSCAMLINGVWSVNTFADTKGLDFGVIPIPQIFNNSDCWGDSHNLVLPAQNNGDKGRETAAVTFMNWVSQNGQIWGQAGHIPANTAAQKSSEFTALPKRSGFVSSVNNVVFPKQSEKTWPLKDIIYKNLETVLNGSTTAETAFKTITDQMNKQLNS